MIIVGPLHLVAHCKINLFIYFIGPSYRYNPLTSEVHLHFFYRQSGGGVRADFSQECIHTTASLLA